MGEHFTNVMPQGDALHIKTISLEGSYCTNKDSDCKASIMILNALSCLLLQNSLDGSYIRTHIKEQALQIGMQGMCCNN